MIVDRHSAFRVFLVMGLVLVMTILSTRLRADSGICTGVTYNLPFTDVMGNTFFCEIAEAFFSGLTNGTSATTYSPAQNVPRDQMAAFITRTMDQSLKRGSRRAALRHFWAPTSANGLCFTSVGDHPAWLESDGTDIWVPVTIDDNVCRVRASDGKLLETWTGADAAFAVLCARGQIYVTGATSPGRLYGIDPTQPAGPVTVVTSALMNNPSGLTFDGDRIWVAGAGGLSIVTLNPVTVNTVTAGLSSLVGIVYDGANVWVTSQSSSPGKLFKLNSLGAIVQTVTVGLGPTNPVFDGTNIWVPNSDQDTVTVVRASTGAIVATLNGNGLVTPASAAFDGERILVTSNGGGLSLWKASSLTRLGSVNPGFSSVPDGVCSDGTNFWVSLNGVDKIARF